MSPVLRPFGRGLAFSLNPAPHRLIAGQPSIQRNVQAGAGVSGTGR